MLRIPCPHCGTRDETEFAFGGPSHLTRPGNDADNSTWTAYLFSRENPVGVQFERWVHLYGCSRWFNVARNTVTHEILKSYPMGDPKPDSPESP